MGDEIVIKKIPVEVVPTTTAVRVSEDVKDVLNSLKKKYTLTNIDVVIRYLLKNADYSLNNK